MRGSESDPPDGGARTIAGEPRWPLMTAVLSYIIITVVLRQAVPNHESLGPRWLVPGLEIALLVALVSVNPAQVAGRIRWLRPFALMLLAALTATAMLSDCVVIVGLVTGSKATDSASSLLASGALTWLGTTLVFGLLYWQLDSGGPLSRYERKREFPDFAFSQQINPELAPRGWQPRYVDYLILGVTTSTAFSPTDVMPMSAWAKLTMALQSLISLSVIGLVIARAVNLFT